MAETIFAIETTCDETSVAIIQNHQLLAVATASQIKDHAHYGGVVPELAARLHLKNLNYLAEQALAESKLSFNDFTLIAYAAEPGLIGCLQQGKMFALTLANALQISALPINHLEGHVYAAYFQKNYHYPALALVISGGHTNFYLLKKPLAFRLIGQTLDDAAGECFDKVGRLLGFNYPAGPLIEQAAQQGKPCITLPQIKTTQPLDFSFSGLKAHCNQAIDEAKAQNQFNQTFINNFAASLQNKIIQEVLVRFQKALQLYPEVKCLIIGGGVSANQALRRDLTKMVSQVHNISLIIPEVQYCTDNAAMIGALADLQTRIVIHQH